MISHYPINRAYRPGARPQVISPEEGTPQHSKSPAAPPIPPAEKPREGSQPHAGPDSYPGTACRENLITLPCPGEGGNSSPPPAPQTCQVPLYSHFSQDLLTPDEPCQGPREDNKCQESLLSEEVIKHKMQTGLLRSGPETQAPPRLPASERFPLTSASP